MEFALKVLSLSSIKVTKQAFIIHIFILVCCFLSVCSAQNLTVNTSGILDDYSEIIGEDPHIYLQALSGFQDTKIDVVQTADTLLDSIGGDNSTPIFDALFENDRGFIDMLFNKNDGIMYNLYDKNTGLIGDPLDPDDGVIQYFEDDGEDLLDILFDEDDGIITNMYQTNGLVGSPYVSGDGVLEKLGEEILNEERIKLTQINQNSQELANISE